MKRGLKTATAIVLFLLILQTCTPFAVATGSLPAAADYSVSNYSGLINTLAQQSIARDTSFTIKYTASLSELQNKICSQMWKDVYAVDVPGTTSDLDYLGNTMSKMNVSWRYSGTYAICEFTQTYLTTASQEKYVNSTVDTILSDLDIDDFSVYGKIRAIHDYIIDNVEYDDSYSRYTAYDALYSHSAVCQGYSLLMYKMLTEAGVPVRIVSGTGNTGGARAPHAWNIVKIGQYWYNVDVTWDDTNEPTKFLLKSNANFSDHTRDSEFNTSVFNAAHPMSPVNYDLNKDVKFVSSIALTSNKGTLFEVGDVFLLSASVTPADATNQTLSWSSSNPSVASVDSSGYVTVKAAGTAVITVSANDGTGKTAKFTLSALAPDTPSAWAQAGINALNACGVIPTELKSSYRDSITRSEFMALIANVYEYAKGPYTPLSGSPFTDISGSAYKNEIALGYELGIVDGVGSNLFGPDNTLTREQCAKIISDALLAIKDTPISSTAVLPYGDAPLISGWAVPYVRNAYERGLMIGSEGNFNPQGVLTREQAMLIAARMIE